MDFAAVLERTAGWRRDEPYLVGYDRSGERTVLGYRAFLERALRLGELFRRLGVGVGDRVATVSRNHPDVLVAYFACWLTGAIACPLNVEEPEERKRYVLDNAGCVLAVVEGPFLDELEALRRNLPALREILPLEELEGLLARTEPARRVSLPATAGAFQVYTSGTTGAPKGVLLSQGNLVANARATASWHGLAAGDGVMTVLPIHHVNGAVVTGLTPFLAGARNILNPSFSPRTFWHRAVAEDVALASVVPTLLEFLLMARDAHPFPGTGRLRYLLCGAGPLLRETLIRFEDGFGLPICHGFGMSETTAYNTQFPMRLSAAERDRWYRHEEYPSVGQALACNEVTVLREDGTEAAPGERGEIALRGPAVMAGYLGGAELNAGAFRRGWFLSGDQGFFRPGEGGERFFFVSGRLKELIVRGGVNISPLDIDEVLRAAPGVGFALAVPFPNRFYGEEVAAYVVAREGVEVDPEAVRRYAAERLPFALQPKVVVTGREVPFTATGKPRRIALAEALSSRLEAFRDIQFRPGSGTTSAEGSDGSPERP